ncbi:deoxyribodipyrimidine photo-lyase like protein [Zymoseptoria brevis]|uniref:Deoxyribodipyrimidine photo-lyase like protein n=1 Tax=Zymoseptoria brevis TaxID=1047168 RepID=A0A0F4GD26_9PEZI|nr:deoxyribodipyrimidine photo-lyase like protein [Zymoseptoria brevis]
MPQKRKAASPQRLSPFKKRNISADKSNSTSTSKQPQDNDSPQLSTHSPFYPPEISSARCAQYASGELLKPVDVLETALSSTSTQRRAIAGGRAVLHWFKRDLRVDDNRALHAASQKAVELGIPLLTMCIVSPQDYEAHSTAPVRVDLELRTLGVLKAELAELNIPLFTTTVERRRDVVVFILSKCEEWGVRHIYCNMEYEVDELRREAKMVKKGLDRGIAVEVLHDDILVPPGVLKNGQGEEFTVYSPWMRAWEKHLQTHPSLTELSPPPTPNPPETQTSFPSLFDLPTPPPPPSKSLAPEERDRFTHLYPAGSPAAHARLTHFLSSKAHSYNSLRSSPAAHPTSLLSPHLSVGSISARTLLSLTRSNGQPSNLSDWSRDGSRGGSGSATWIRELAWREFYRHIMISHPWISMGKPFQYSLSPSTITWTPEPLASTYFHAWSLGRTGIPIIDAGMRQLLHLGWMHNRLRMITASFLAHHLGVDWRRGEEWFMLHLVDGDVASNSGGWGFCSGTGVERRGYLRIFNPWSQGKEFDADGEFGRRWVSELEGVEGKVIHDEGGNRGSLYPRPVIGHKEGREGALERWRGQGGAEN